MSFWCLFWWNISFISFDTVLKWNWIIIWLFHFLNKISFFKIMPQEITFREVKTFVRLDNMSKKYCSFSDANYQRTCVERCKRPKNSLFSSSFVNICRHMEGLGHRLWDKPSEQLDNVVRQRLPCCLRCILVYPQTFWHHITFFKYNCPNILQFLNILFWPAAIQTKHMASHKKWLKQ